MGGISTALRRHRIVGFDTSIFIYHIEGNSPFTPGATESLEELGQGAFLGVTSIISLMEKCVKPLQSGQSEIADEYELFLLSIANLAVVDILRTTIRRAAEPRAHHRLRSADALQVAACLQSSAMAFLSNDKRLKRVQDAEVPIVSDFLDG